MTPIHILYVSQNKNVLMQKIKSIPDIEKTLATISMSIEQLVKIIFDFKFSIIPDLGRAAGSMGPFGVCNINYKYYTAENIPKYIDVNKPQKSDFDAVINSLSGGNLKLAKVFLNYKKLKNDSFTFLPGLFFLEFMFKIFILSNLENSVSYLISGLVVVMTIIWYYNNHLKKTQDELLHLKIPIH